MLLRLVGPAHHRHRHRTLAAFSASTTSSTAGVSMSSSSSSSNMSSGGQHLRFSQSDEEQGQEQRGPGSRGRGGGGGGGGWNRGRRDRGGDRGSSGRFQHAQQHQWRGGGDGWLGSSTSSAPPQWRTGHRRGGGGGGQGGYGYHQQHHHQQQPQQQPPQRRRNDLARFRRPWIKLKDYYGLQQQQDPSAAHPQTMPPTFTLLSWNVLAESLVDREGYLGYATEEELDWLQRGPRVHEMLRRFGADVVCLQEDDHHEEVRAALGSEYEGVFKKRTGPEKRDGCSIFWKTGRFRLQRAEEVEYLVPGTQHLDRDNVGVIAVLEDMAVPAVEREEGGKRRGGGRRRKAAVASSSSSEGEGEEGKGKGERRRRLLVVANTHLLFNPRRGDVKLAQVQMLLRRLEALIAELQSPSSSPAAVAGTKEDEGNDVAVGLVLAGDFNSTPISAIYHLLSAGELDTRSLNRSWVAGQGWGLMLRSGPHRKMMPYSELAPPSASLSDPHQSQQKRGEEGEGKGRGIRTYRHFGAGTARGVFRPHVRREGAAADMEADEEMGKMRSVARESGLGDSSEGEDEEEEMDVVPRTAVELPAHVPRPLWRHPEEWSREDNGEPIRHALELQSAYAHRPAAHTTGEPAFTTFHAEFKGTVDYVWLTRETLRCSAILGMPALGELASQEGLPCAANPSDHLPLLTKLRFRV